MSGGITLGGLATAAAAGVAMAAVTSAMAPKPPKAPEMPKVETPVAQQAAQTPDQQMKRQEGTGITGAAAQGTNLTGDAGVDPMSLMLGKNKLLGQ